ncbi:hypothetical protein CA601_31975 [Paraburkholderia hospita]|nr:hypothetical protein CA601_31975 [Paraburkholderia hospita]
MSNRCIMMAYLSERENVVEQVVSVCLRLFDTWCEKLAYRLPCWPVIGGVSRQSWRPAAFP